MIINHYKTIPLCVLLLEYTFYCICSISRVFNTFIGLFPIFPISASSAMGFSISILFSANKLKICSIVACLTE